MKQNKEKFKKLLDFAPEAFFQKDKNNNFIFVNKKAVILTGYSEKELLSMNINDILSIHTSKEKQLKYCPNYKGNIISYEKEIKRKDRSIIPVEVVSRRMPDGTSQCFVRDITQRKINEEKIKKNNEFLESAHSIMLRWTPNRKISFINNYGCKLFGYKKNELIGKDVGILVPNRDKSGKDLTDLIDDITKNHKDYYFNENENIKKDGSRFWVDWSNRVTKDKKGKLIEVFTIGIDVSERKKIELERDLIALKIKENESFLKEAQEISSFGSYNLDIKKQSWVGSNMLCQILGINNKNVHTFKEWVNSVHVDDREMMIKYFKNEVLRNGVPFNKFYRVINKKSHSTIWVHGKGKLEFDSGKNPIRMIGTIQDITESKEIDEAKSNFLSMTSHQLRTPLSISKWVLESLADQGYLNDKQKSKLKELIYSNERLIHLVDDLLKVSTIDIGKLKINKKDVDFRKLLTRLISSLKDLTKTKNKNIKIIIPSSIKYIYCDPLLIYEALENLLINAVLYSTKNSKNINIRIIKNKDKYIISVNNDGVISTKSLRQISKFDKFTRGHSATNIHPEGSGLGLYIAKKIVELNGGNLYLESNTKSGTTFSLTIIKNK